MKKSQREKKRVLVFFGMTATGKSYVARAWAERWHNPYLNSDVVRKELAGRLPKRREKSAINNGIYSPAFTRLTYDELLSRAERVLLKDETSGLVLDASYQSRLERDFVRNRLMPEYRVLFVHCTCSDEVVRKRLNRRLNDPQAVSDGNLQVYLEQKKNFEMPRELDSRLLVTLETDKELSELLQDLQTKMCAMGEIICLSSSSEEKKGVV
jgi:predicted kinase